MPARFKGFLYNCMVAVVNGRVEFMYPKSVLCNDDIYRESRWFVPWQRKYETVDYQIPPQYGFKQVCYFLCLKFCLCKILLVLKFIFQLLLNYCYYFRNQLYSEAQCWNLSTVSKSDLRCAKNFGLRNLLVPNWLCKVWIYFAMPVAVTMCLASPVCGLISLFLAPRPK